MPSTFLACGRLRMATLFLLIIGLLNLAFAAPINQGMDVQDANSLTKREHQPATKVKNKRTDTMPDLAECTNYLKDKYPPATNQYMFYTGNAENQLLEYQKVNQGTVGFRDFWNADASAHYTEVFGDRPEDGEMQMKAMAQVAEGKVPVFGGLQYKNYDSFYKTAEVPDLSDGLRTGRVTELDHMTQDAKSPDQIAATQDARENFQYRPGFDENTKNTPDVATNDGTTTPCKRSPDGACNTTERPYGNPAQQVKPNGEVVDPGRTGTPGTLPERPTTITNPAKPGRVPGRIPK